METNAVISQVLDTGSQVVSRIAALDPANLVWILAIVLGYVLKWIEVFPNRFIPVVSFVATVASYVAMVFKTGQEPKRYVIDIACGVIFWGFAWGVHAAILKKWIDEKLFKVRPATPRLSKGQKNNL